MAATDAPAAPRSRAVLEILGRAGDAVSIYARDRGDPPPAPIFEGRVPGNGRLRLKVPRSALVVVAEGYPAVPVRFDGGETFHRVDLSRESAGRPPN